MKLKTFFLSLALSAFLIVPVFVFAQADLKTPVSNGDLNTPISQCGDGFDNDGDKLIDKKGGIIDGVTVAADPQCLVSGATCENGTTTCFSGPKTCGSGLCLDISIKNPLKVSTVQEALALFMNAVIKIALPFIVLFFIWSGFNFVLARGNPDKLKDAKKMFWYTIIGTLLILGAWTITNAIIGTVNTITG